MSTAGPFPSSLAHLLAETARAALLLHVHTLADQHRPTPPSSPAGEHIYDLIDAPPFANYPPLSPALAEAHAEATRMAAQINARAAESLRQGISLRLPLLAQRFDLERIDLDLLLLALAPELNRACAAHGRPTAGLALDALALDTQSHLNARRRLDPAAPLIHHELLQLGADPSTPTLLRTLDIDPRIAAFLLGDDALNPHLQPFVSACSPTASLGQLILPDSLPQQLARFLDQHGSTTPAPILYLEGPYGSGKRTLAEALCAHLSLPLLRANASALLPMAEHDARRLAAQVTREARLRGAALHWVGGGDVFQSDSPNARSALFNSLTEYPGLCFISGSRPWNPVDILRHRSLIHVYLPRLSPQAQLHLWERSLGDQRTPDVDIHALTTKFRFTGGQIRDATAAARDLARLRDPSGGLITMSDLEQACRGHGKQLGVLAQLLPPRHGWDDLVLPLDRKAILREICAHFRRRNQVLGDWGLGRKLSTGKGLVALFSGPPGTGKSMAAGVIAAELNLPLYHIDLSSVVSKYIGETEKHLAQLFDEAEAANAALFFDEADALFGKRTEVRDAHDRYANIETSYLLQRLETYEGVVLLASNLMKNIDDAFVRRLSFAVEFPFPNVAERLRIWQGFWTPELPLDPDVDLALLAQRVELSGGYLRNIALAAAYLAAEEGASVAMRHLLHATRREYQKMGKVLDHGVLAPNR